MKPYQDKGRDSGVIGYEDGTGYIIVEFDKAGKDGARFYLYTHESSGEAAIDAMKSLAVQGEGLNEYINRNRVAYASKAATLSGLR